VLLEDHCQPNMKSNFSHLPRAIEVHPLQILARCVFGRGSHRRPARRRGNSVGFFNHRILAHLLLLCTFGLHAQADTKGGGPSLQCSAAAANSAWQLARTDPAALMQKASQNELVNSYGKHPLLRYRLRKITAKTDTTKEIVETLDGGVARLLAEQNHPLTPEQEQAELQRLHTLASDPARQAHRRRHENRDAAQLTEIMRLLPAAFIYRYAGAQQTPGGTAIRLTFEPNPKFSPPDLVARILTGIRGEVWIDPSQLRVVQITGNLFRHVNYGWGLLGVLDPGGRISITQAKTPAGGWQMSHLVLSFQGKALLLKTLQVNVDETAWSYHRVPADWHYQDAVRWLMYRDFSITPAP